MSKVSSVLPVVLQKNCAALGLGSDGTKSLSSEQQKNLAAVTADFGEHDMIRLVTQYVANRKDPDVDELIRLCMSKRVAMQRMPKALTEMGCDYRKLRLLDELRPLVLMSRRSNDWYSEVATGLTALPKVSPEAIIACYKILLLDATADGLPGTSE